MIEINEDAKLSFWATVIVWVVGCTATAWMFTQMAGCLKADSDKTLVREGY